MIRQSQTVSADVFRGDASSGWNYRGLVIVAGMALVLLGAAAVWHDMSATLVSVALLGGLLTIAGLLQIAHGLQVREPNGFVLYLVDGVIRTTVGGLMVLFPEGGALSLTLIVSTFLIVVGLFKVIGSRALRFPQWQWSAASGGLSMALGGLLAVQWPASGLWFVGLAIGLDLMWYGCALLMFAGSEQYVDVAAVNVESTMRYEQG